MKKLLTLVFVFATVLVSTNVLTSCKDYDEDYKNDLARLIDTEHIDIWSAIKTNYSILRVAADSLYDLQEACSLKCKETRDSLDARYSRLVIEDGKLWAAINGKADTAVVNALQDTVAALRADIDSLTKRVADLETSEQEIRGDIDDINDAIDDINDEIAGIKEKYATVAQLTDSTEKIWDYLRNLPAGTIDEADMTQFLTNTFNITNTTINDIQGDLSELQDAIKDVYTKEQIDKAFKNVRDSLILIDNNVADVKTTADDALRLARLDSTWIAELQKVVEKGDSALNARVDSLAEVVKNLNIPDPYDDTQVIKNKDSIYINAQAIESLRDDLDKYIEKNDARVDSLAQVTSDLADLIEQAEQNRKDADELLQKQINAIVLALADQKEKDAEQDAAIETLGDLINTSIADLEKAYKEADEQLAQDIKDLEERVKANEENIEKLDKKIDEVKEELEGRLDQVDETLKQLITGIIPQAVVNPVYGTFAAPAGISSKVLIAFYGETSLPVVFPTDATGNYVKNSQTFTEKDWEMVKATLKDKYTKPGKSTLLSDEENNAGTLYLTVNPGNVDFKDQQLVLVNSKDEESKIALSKLKKENDYLINFGWTRAADDNGFYSATAHLNETDIDAVKVNIDTEMKSTFKELLQKRTMSKVGELALNIYDQFNGILPAQAVKAEWTIKNSKGEDIKQSFRSEYGLAATAIKPLSYRFLEDLDVQTIPGYERVISFIDEISKEVKKVVSEAWPNLKNFDKDAIIVNKLGTVDPNRFKVTFSLSILTDGVDSRASRQTIGDLEYLVVENRIPNGVDLAGNVNAWKWVTAMKLALNDDDAVAAQDTGNPLKWNLTITKNVGNIQDIYNSIDGAIDAIGDFVDDVNDMLNDINGVETSINTNVDNALDKIRNLVDRINNRAANLINTANRRIQPVLLLTSKNTGSKRLSRVPGLPTLIKDATVTLIPTSYTADVVAPAFKKHIVAVDVIKGEKSAQGGDTDCQNVLKDFNGQDKINTVIPGSTRTVTATFKPGYTYVIAYSALDYHGNISMHKCYVRY